MRDTRPHVLAFPFPAQGHVNPLMILCRRLASMGVVITFVNNTTSSSSSHVSHGGDKDFRFLSMPADCLPKSRLGNNIQLFLNSMEVGMRGELENVLEQLMNDQTRPRVTCILSDAFIGWTQDVAVKFEIDRAALWTSCATWALICMHFPLLRSHGLLPTRGSDKVIDFIPGVPLISAKHLPDTVHVEDEYDPGFDLRFHRNEIMRNDAWVFVNSFDEMEPGQVEQLKKEIPDLVPVGPLLPPQFFDDVNSDIHVEENINSNPLWKEDLSCLEWLDKREKCSVVYVSFGSLATVSKEDVQELLTGLDKSGHAFLWVLRLDLLEERDEVYEKIRQNKRGLVISWAPQLKVLRHPSLGAFLTHCGWNSTTEAIAAGVPMLCRPCFAEQSLNCALVVDHLKVGLRATDGLSNKVDAGRIEAVVKLIMGDGSVEMRKRARELSDAAMLSVKRAGSSLQAFKQSCTK